MKKEFLINSTLQNEHQKENQGMAIVNNNQDQLRGQPRRLLSPYMHLRLVQGILKELNLEPCGDDL